MKRIRGIQDSVQDQALEVREKLKRTRYRSSSSEDTFTGKQTNKSQRSVMYIG